jgi:hypothetical protein
MGNGTEASQKQKGRSSLIGLLVEFGRMEQLKRNGKPLIFIQIRNS